MAVITGKTSDRIDQLLGKLVTSLSIANGRLQFSTRDGTVTDAGPIDIVKGAITGEIKMWPTATAPTGYLLCNGFTFSADTYPDLAALLGDTYGQHSGISYYLPDFRGRSPLGAGTASPAVAGGTAHTLGQKGGEEKHTQTVAEMPAHKHPYNIGYSEWSTANWNLGSGSANRNTSLDSVQDTGSIGSGTPFNVLNPYLGINFIIKT